MIGCACGETTLTRPAERHGLARCGGYELPPGITLELVQLELEVEHAQNTCPQPDWLSVAGRETVPACSRVA